MATILGCDERNKEEEEKMMEKAKEKKKGEEKKIGLVFFRVFWKSQASHQQCPIRCRELETHNLPVGPGRS